MAKPDIGIPERPASRSRARWRWGIALGMVTLFILLACVTLALYIGRTPTYELPTIVILDPQYGAELIPDKAVLVLSSARSPIPIVKEELWVDGLLVYVSNARNAQGQKNLTATMSWTPKAGPHSLVARAVDAQGSVGVSDVVRVTVLDGATRDERKNSIQIAEEGDTLGSIANEKHVSPEDIREANPDLPDQLKPGDWVNVPPGEGEGSRNDDHDEGIVQDPGADVLPDNLPGGQADPNRGLLSFGAPLFFWDTIVPWRDPRHTAPNAPKLKVEPGPNCTARLTWWDTSDNEKGFYLYRLVLGAARFERIEPFFRANNGGGALSYTDQGVFGHIEYYVAAFNGAGEAASRTVGVNVPGANCLGEVSAQMLEVEAESLTAPGYDEMYCYASLRGHRPFERVPFDETKYLKWMSFGQAPHRPEFLGRWNLEEYYGGPNKRVVAAPPDGQSFQVEVECWWAAQNEEGGVSFSLGSFSQSHPPEEWDGRALTGRGDSFTVVYHIRPWRGPAGNSGAALDPDISAPFNLRPARGINDCAAHTTKDVGAMIACALADYSDHPPLVWEWNGMPEQIDGFRMYLNRVPVGGTFVPLDDTPKDFLVWASAQRVPCGETWRYAVSAFDLNVESQMSEFMALGGEECDNLAVVEVELLNLKAVDLDDGFGGVWGTGVAGTVDVTMETYGSIFFYTSTSDWIRVSEQKLRVASDIMPVDIESGGSYLWKDLPLCREGGGGQCWAPNQNKMVFLLSEGDALSGGVRLEDADDWPNGDDHWCYMDIWLEGRSLDAWASLDQTLNEEDPNPYYGKCSIGVRVRGLGRGGRSHVLAPGSGGPAATAKKAGLTITSIERNGAGNARLTIHNAGPDTLVVDTVTLDFQAARVPSAEGGSPGTIWEHQERASLTIPVFEQTTVDTGQVLLEGYENRVRVVLRADNFTDPNLRNNAFCRSIDVPDAEHVTIGECAREPLTEGF